MSLRIANVAKKDLPDEATHGFRILDGEEVLMFFHWHEEPVEEQLIYNLRDDEDVPKGIDPSLTRTLQTRTSYADVLKALPDRLDAMGYEDERDAIMGEIIGGFGSGNKRR